MANLRQLLFDYNLTQQQFADIIGAKQSEVSLFINGKRTLGSRHINALTEYFKKDIIAEYTTSSEQFNPQSRQATVTILTPDIIEEAKELGREEVRSDVALSVPFVGKDIATAPDINIRQLIERNDSTLELFPFAKMTKGVDYIQTVITMAMAPRYLPGDYLFIRFRDGQILSGKIYLVDTKPYGTMLRLVYIEEGGYTLKALNPEFKDVYVKVDDVFSISSVVLSVNTNTSLTSELNLASLVKNRDSQIATLTEAQNTMLAQQQTLIDEVRKQNERMDEERKRNNALVDKIINKDN